MLVQPQNQWFARVDIPHLDHALISDKDSWVANVSELEANHVITGLPMELKVLIWKYLLARNIPITELIDLYDDSLTMSTMKSVLFDIISQAEFKMDELWRLSYVVFGYNFNKNLLDIESALKVPMFIFKHHIVGESICLELNSKINVIRFSNYMNKLVLKKCSPSISSYICFIRLCKTCFRNVDLVLLYNRLGLGFFDYLESDGIYSKVQSLTISWFSNYINLGKYSFPNLKIVRVMYYSKFHDPTPDFQYFQRLLIGLQKNSVFNIRLLLNWSIIPKLTNTFLKLLLELRLKSIILKISYSRMFMPSPKNDLDILELSPLTGYINYLNHHFWNGYEVAKSTDIINSCTELTGLIITNNRHESATLRLTFSFNDMHMLKSLSLESVYVEKGLINSFPTGVIILRMVNCSFDDIEMLLSPNLIRLDIIASMTQLPRISNTNQLTSLSSVNVKSSNRNLLREFIGSLPSTLFAISVESWEVSFSKSQLSSEQISFNSLHKLQDLTLRSSLPTFNLDLLPWSLRNCFMKVKTDCVVGTLPGRLEARYLKYEEGMLNYISST